MCAEGPFCQLCMVCQLCVVRRIASQLGNERVAALATRTASQRESEAERERQTDGERDTVGSRVEG